MGCLDSVNHYTGHSLKNKIMENVRIFLKSFFFKIFLHLNHIMLYLCPSYLFLLYGVGKSRFLLPQPGSRLEKPRCCLDDFSVVLPSKQRQYCCNVIFRGKAVEGDLATLDRNIPTYLVNPHCLDEFDDFKDLIVITGDAAWFNAMDHRLQRGKITRVQLDTQDLQSRILQDDPNFSDRQIGSKLADTVVKVRHNSNELVSGFASGLAAMIFCLNKYDVVRAIRVDQYIQHNKKQFIECVGSNKKLGRFGAAINIWSIFYLLELSETLPNRLKICGAINLIRGQHWTKRLRYVFYK